MTLTLILIRHAKSDWDDPLLSDHDRPLNARGHRSAPRIGAWLAKEGFCPEEVLISDAMRTQQTWAGIAPYLPDAPAPSPSRGLYLASPDTMLAHLHRATGQTVAMVAHNPGIAAFADMLAATPPHHAGFRAYPTGATTVLGFNADTWADVQPNIGIVRAFATPRDLPDPS